MIESIYHASILAIKNLLGGVNRFCWHFTKGWKVTQKSTV